MKPLRQYFCMVPFVFQYFTKGILRFFSCHGDFARFGQNCTKYMTRKVSSDSAKRKQTRMRFKAIFPSLRYKGRGNFFQVAIYFHPSHLQVSLYWYSKGSRILEYYCYISIDRNSSLFIWLFKIILKIGDTFSLLII